MAKKKDPKLGNKDMAVAFQLLRRSSAASPHVNRRKYNRKRSGWEKEI